MSLCNYKSSNLKIKQEVLVLLNAKFNIPSSFFRDSNEESSEAIIPLSPCEMVYMIHILEDKFGFRFTETNFNDPHIHTIDGLTRIIGLHINKIRNM